MYDNGLKIEWMTECLLRNQMYNRCKFNSEIRNPNSTVFQDFPLSPLCLRVG